MGANELEHKCLGQRAVHEEVMMAFDVPSELSVEMNEMRIKRQG
jgi:hypothetical protein